MDAWLAAERPAVSATVDLSEGEEEWITDRIMNRVREVLQ